MAVTWQYSIGNLARRAPADPAPVSPAAEDSLLPLVNLANDFPDEQGGFTWRSDGVYDVDFDLNMLAITSSRADAPTGWRDLLLSLAGTPGLAADVPSYGTFGGRTSALRVYWPSFQEIEVMPDEDLKLNIGLYRPTAAAGATGARVVVTDLWSGKSWNGSAWADGGVLAVQTTVDTWSDVTEEITADSNRTERSTYRVTVEPVAASYDDTSYVYFSLNGANGAPALVAEADVMAIIGHNIPDDAVVALGATSMTPAFPSFSATDTSVFTQTWRLSIDMPSGNRVRPIIGEVWIGKLRTFLNRPQLSLRLTEGDANQIRVEGARGRQEVLSDLGRRPAADLSMGFKISTEASYTQARDEFTRGTKFGAEPLLFLPDSTFEGSGRLFHGRIDNRVSYSRIHNAWREYKFNFRESPLAAL